MDVTPKKLLNSDKNCFVCSVAVNSKQRMRVFKSGSKGTSSVDLQGLNYKQDIGHRRNCLLEFRRCSMH